MLSRNEEISPPESLIPLAVPNFIDREEKRVKMGQNAIISAGGLVLKNVGVGEIQFGTPNTNNGSNYDRLA